MVRDSSNSTRREQAIHDARRRLTLVEIETHRIKAELARLESENEIELADELAGDLRERVDALVCAGANGRMNHAAGAVKAVTEVPSSPALRVDLSPGRKAVKAPAVVPKVLVATGDGVVAPKRRRRRKLSPGWVVSLGLHTAVFAVLAPMTYVAFTNTDIPLFASMFDFGETHFDPGVVPVEMVAVDELEIQEASLNDTSLPMAESLSEDFAPLASSPSGDLAPTAGQLNTLPTDIGTLMAGGGSGEGPGGGGGRAGRNDMAGTVGRTSFFGTPARANRVVFLVDNSGSMKQGRMETTLDELARSIDALSEKQEFYVVFYSDQAYPMLYPNSVMEPLAATKENKQRLYNWLHTVELCQGGALLKAMEIAKSLEPHVVYLLSDGDITGTVTMQRLTQTNDHPFSVHTLGMGVSKPQDAQNLLAIAQANRGMFQMVRPLPAAVQSAKQRPIRSNGRGVAWGQGVP